MAELIQNITETSARRDWSVAAPGGHVDSSGPPQNVEALTFEDVVDAINPLHHMPVIGTLYRAVTGDHISGHARGIGDMLYGGPVAAVMGAVASLVEDVSGKEPGAHVIAMLTGQEGPIADLLNTDTSPENPSVPPAKTAAPIMVASLNMPDTPPSPSQPESEPTYPSAIDRSPVESVIESAPDESGNDVAAPKETDSEGNTKEIDVETQTPQPSSVDPASNDNPGSDDSQEGIVSAGPVRSQTGHAATHSQRIAGTEASPHLAYGGVMAPASRAAPIITTDNRKMDSSVSYAAQVSPSGKFFPLNKPAPTSRPISLTPQQIQNVQEHATAQRPSQDRVRGSDPLPPDLVHDMMLLNLQKYSQMQGVSLPSPSLPDHDG